MSLEKRRLDVTESGMLQTSESMIIDLIIRLLGKFEIESFEMTSYKINLTMKKKEIREEENGR